MSGSIDYNNVDIEALLSDQCVRQFLRIVDEHPMWTINEMVDSLSNNQDVKELSYEDAEVILIRLGFSTQGVRTNTNYSGKESFYKKEIPKTGSGVLSKAPGSYNKVLPVVRPGRGRKRKTTAATVPKARHFIRRSTFVRQRGNFRRRGGRSFSSPSPVTQISIFELFSVCYFFIKGLRIKVTFAFFYYLIVFVLIGVLYYLTKVNDFDRVKYSFLSDVSLPVVVENSSDIMGVNGSAASEEANVTVK